MTDAQRPAHPGLAAAAAAYVAQPSAETFARLAAQFQYGHAMLPVAGSTMPARTAADGTVHLSFPNDGGVGTQAMDIGDGRRALVIYTGATPIEQPDAAAVDIAAVLPRLHGVLSSTGLEFVVVDPTGPAAVMPRHVLDRLAAEPNEPELRAALELGAERRAAVLTQLESAQWLTLAWRGPGPGPDAPGTEFRTGVAPDGRTRILAAYTSPIEATLRGPDDRVATMAVDAVLQMSVRDGNGGLILNPGSSWIVLTRRDVEGALKRRAKAAKRAARRG